MYLKKDIRGKNLDVLFLLLSSSTFLVRWATQRNEEKISCSCPCSFTCNLFQAKRKKKIDGDEEDYFSLFFVLREDGKGRTDKRHGGERQGPGMIAEVLSSQLEFCWWWGSGRA